MYNHVLHHKQITRRLEGRNDWMINRVELLNQCDWYLLSVIVLVKLYKWYLNFSPAFKYTSASLRQPILLLEWITSCNSLPSLFLYFTNIYHMLLFVRSHALREKSLWFHDCILSREGGYLTNKQTKLLILISESCSKEYKI